MERKVNKSPKSKTTKKPTVKKNVVRKTNTKKKKNKKPVAFTLIELLAVIIILGLIMLIAIPSVTRHINDTKKKTYVDTAKQVVKSAITMVNSGELEVYDLNTTYYIPASCIPTENSLSSPFGEFVDAYVIVVYNGDGYTYYWTSVDETHQGIEVKEFDKITTNDIKTGIESVDTSVGIGLRTKVKILDKEGCSTFSSNVIVYPEGKTKDSLVPGDLINIGPEEFYVVRRNGEDLVLLSHYNLKVGSIYTKNHSKIGEIPSSDPGYGRQDPLMKGSTNSDTYYGTIKFTNSNYWNGKIGDGLKYPGVISSSITSTNCAYIYDNNSLLYPYIESYKAYLEELGAEVKEARLLTVNELYNFRNVGNAYKDTSYWLGNVYNEYSTIWGVFDTGYIAGNPSVEYFYGIRPVIVI